MWTKRGFLRAYQMVNLLGCSLNILNSYVPKAIISGQTTVWTPATVWMSFPMGAAANLDAKCNYDRTSLFWTHEPTGLHSDCWLVQLLSLTWVVGLWEGDELLKMYVSSLKIHSQGEPPPICALIKHGQLSTMANSRDTSFPPPRTAADFKACILFMTFHVGCHLHLRAPHYCGRCCFLH